MYGTQVGVGSEQIRELFKKILPGSDMQCAKNKTDLASYLKVK
jgi:hypothetical protein